MSKSPAVDVAKEIAEPENSELIITSAGGVRVRIKPVSSALLDEVTSRIKDPEVPMWRNEDKGRDEPNPDDPKYVEALADTNRRRGLAAMDAMIMFGMELVDGLPLDTDWLKRLKYLEKRGSVDLSSYDQEDPFDMEFLYKRYIVADNETLTLVSNVSAMSMEEIRRLEASFRNKAKR